MTYFWTSPAVRRRGDGAFVRAAHELGCDLATILAFWEVEAGGSGLWADGTIKRRFEPHHMPGASKRDWRKSLAIARKRRETMLRAAYDQNAEAALMATSWHGPQIMGFNHMDAGHATARHMVDAMIRDPDAAVAAFVTLIQRWEIDGALRARDWLAAAERYNGSGQAARYAALIEAAYRRHSGAPSDPVLRIGARGAAVLRLQQALAITEDGLFGPATKEAVRSFQSRNGLKVDGVVGARTWTALRDRGEIEAAPMPGGMSAPAATALALGIVAGGVAIWNWITNRGED